MAATKHITRELQELVAESPHIEKVYIGANGRVYLYAHSLIAKQGDTEKKLYGEGISSHWVLIPGEWNVDNLREQVAKGVPETLIVDEISREEILATELEVKTESIVDKIREATLEEKQKFLAELLPADMMEALRKISSGGA